MSVGRKKAFKYVNRMLPLFRAALKFCSINRLFKWNEYMVWDDNVEDLHDVGSRCLLLDTRALVMESTELALESSDLEKED